MKKGIHQSCLAFLAILGAFLMAGCSGTALLNSIVTKSGYTLHKDIAYGSLNRQKLDIYVPDHVKDDSPVIVFFYGGSWQEGSKNDYRFVGQAFSSKGYVTVIADYRLYPEVRFPAFIDDAVAVVIWANKNIKEYHGSHERIFVAGHSAGAYIAMMLGTHSSYAQSLPPKSIKGTIGIAGPYDFLPFTDPKIKDIFSTEKDTKTQPIYWVKENLSSIFLATGDQDKDVLPKNTTNMARALNQKENSVTEKVYPDTAHIGIVLSLADGFRSKTTLLEDIHLFIQNTLKKEQP